MIKEITAKVLLSSFKQPDDWFGLKYNMNLYRGCQHQCTFCDNHDRIYRPRDVRKVVGEIILCREMGYRSIDFYDDNFVNSKRHARELCLEMQKQKPGKTPPLLFG